MAVPRETTPSTAFLRSQVPRRHPSAAVLGEERMGAAVAVGVHHVLTAHYLVLGASRVQLAGADGRPRDVRRFRVDHETGLALLTVDGPPLRPARLREHDEVAPGESVFLLTCTSKGERKGATGHVCIVGPFEAFWEYMLDRAIMTTAINPGLAGAPLFDSEGRLVGIVSLSLAAVGRYSLAIPIDLYLRRREALEAETPDPDRPARAWTGIYPQAYDGGVALTGVVPGGPGEQAGLARGDLILSVDGHTVASLRELYAALWKRAPGESISLQVLRDGAIRVVEVMAGDRDEFYK
ncbi:MAG TPA: S1C family serine protease [Vicinamibacteria bacterium]|nr:S1C family serine protease [Vicinamibacteria bacterium]